MIPKDNIFVLAHSYKKSNDKKQQLENDIIIGKFHKLSLR
jgi:hypothetical protein